MDDTGQRELLADLVQQHYALVYRFAYRLTGRVADAEDLTQQTFLSAQSHLLVVCECAEPLFEAIGEKPRRVRRHARLSGGSADRGRPGE